MRALKSILGTELMHERTRLARTSVAFADVIGAFIRQLKQRTGFSAVPSINVLGRPGILSAATPRAMRGAQDELEAIAQARVPPGRVPVRADAAVWSTASQVRAAHRADHRCRRRDIRLFRGRAEASATGRAAR
jgi:hypothetical protein